MFATAVPISSPSSCPIFAAAGTDCSPAAADFAKASADELFKDLVRSHQKSLHSFVLRKIGNHTDAEELTQQAFVEAARTIGTFRGDSALSTWLFGIAMNLVRNHLSRSPQRRYAFEDEAVLETLACPSPSPQRRLESSELLGQLKRELACLPAEMREVMLLIAVDEVSYEEAAVMLSVPIGTVRSRLSRARSALRKRLAVAGIDRL